MISLHHRILGPRISEHVLLNTAIDVFEYETQHLYLVEKEEDFSRRIADQGVEGFQLLDAFGDLDDERDNAHAAGDDPEKFCHGDD